MAFSRDRVLVIAQDPWMVPSMAEALAADGLEVAFTASGEDAVREAAVRRPALMLVDLRMPGMNGWETLERIKTDAATRDVPVVVFSGPNPGNGRVPQDLVQLVRKHLAAGAVTARAREAS